MEAPSYPPSLLNGSSPKSLGGNVEENWSQASLQGASAGKPPCVAHMVSCDEATCLLPPQRQVAVQECLLPCITGLGRAESGPESSQQHRGLACAPVPGCVSRGCIHFRVLLCLSGAHWVLGPPDFSFNPSSETLLGIRNSLTFPEHLWPPAAALSSLAVTPWGGLTSACYRIGVGD